jgi:N-acetylmuramoyl-L-alanine amidase
MQEFMILTSGVYTVVVTVERPPPPCVAPDNALYCAQFGRASIITAVVKKKFQRAGGKAGLFAARRWSLHHCHRMLTAVTVASSLTMSLAIFEPAWPEEIQQARREPQPSKCDRSQFRVILDVGHTADALGANSARNVPEYYFNYRLAAQMERILIEDGFDKTVLLVAGGRARPSLFDRVARANGLSANLFVSIHHDSVPDKLLERWEFEGKESHFSDRFSGHSIFVSYKNPHLNGSLLFGRLLGKELKDRGLRYARQYTLPIMGRYRRKLVDPDVGVYRYDQLVVLRRTRMPAVLLEAGSIINREEELQMNSAERLDLISASLISAVEMFCDRRRPDRFRG